MKRVIKAVVNVVVMSLIAVALTISVIVGICLNGTTETRLRVKRLADALKQFSK